MAEGPRAVVLGVGNVLVGDDGAGVHAVRLLARQGLPEDVLAFDLGTALLDLPAEADGCRRLVVIDAVRSGGRPGSVYRLELDRLPGGPAGPLSLHGLDLRRALVMARLGGMELPPAVLVGVEAAQVAPGEELSAPVRRALGRVAEAVRREIGAALAPAAEEVRA